jgi:hypothetical protein|tara:strand:- start:2 stop:1213 length:1212 start_codon:yes stop_codon:yes gene_type:complete
MPKVVKRLKVSNCDTLQIYQYNNSKNWFVKFYVGTHYSKSGMYDKTLKLKNQKEAVKKAKELWRSFDFNEKKVTKDYDFDKDIAEPFFKLRKKQYENKGKVEYANKEHNQYRNKILPVFKDLDYRNNEHIENAIEDLVSNLKKDKFTETTISKYMNMLSQMCKRAFNNRVLPIMPEFPTMSRINEDRPSYFAKDLKKIVDEYNAEYQRTENKEVDEEADIISMWRSAGFRPGLELLKVKWFQVNLLDNKNYGIKDLIVTLNETKTKKRHHIQCNPYFVNNIFITRVMPRYQNRKSDDYLFFPDEKNRNKLYERIRRRFKRISIKCGTYFFNGKERPLYSIRHFFGNERYEKDLPVQLITSNMNTSVQMFEKNYKSNSKEHIIAEGEKLFKDQYTKMKVKKTSK